MPNLRTTQGRGMSGKEWGRTVDLAIALATLRSELEYLCERAEERDGRIAASAIRKVLAEKETQ